MPIKAGIILHSMQQRPPLLLISDTSVLLGLIPAFADRHSDLEDRAFAFRAFQCAGTAFMAFDYPL